MYFFNPAKLQLSPFPAPSFLQIPQRPPEPSPHLPQGLRKAEPHLAGDIFGDLLVVRFGDAARDAGEGVAVAAERDSPWHFQDMWRVSTTTA